MVLLFCGKRVNNLDSLLKIPIHNLHVGFFKLLT
jgi:hypothetical protein